MKCIDDHEIQVCESITYRIDFTPSKDSKESFAQKKKHDVDSDLMKSLFTTTLAENNNDKLNAIGFSVWKEAPHYLILSSPEYESSIERFANWKRCMGFNAKTVYSEEWNNDNIKMNIQRYYESVPNLEYVLLVGDATTLPPIKHKKEGDFDAHYSDYTYGCMDGENDMEQDVIVGRLNVSNESEAYNVIDKIIKYEKNPSKDDNFYKKAFHASCFQDDNKDGYEDRRFTKTCEDIRNGLGNTDYEIDRIYFAKESVVPSNWNRGSYSYGEPISDDLLKPMFKWDGDASDIIESINDGVFYILHRDHGSYSGWGDPKFTIESLSLLHNGDKLPVCFSINCQSGAFSGTYIDDSDKIIEKSFSEELLRMSGGGAVGVISASETSYSGINDVMTMEMFQGIWPKSPIMTSFYSYNTDDYDNSVKPIYALGSILSRGKNGMAERYRGSSSMVNYTKRIFHCFGDPSMEIYTSKPKQIPYMINENHTALQTYVPVKFVRIATDNSVTILNGTKFQKTIDASYYKHYMVGHNLIPLRIDPVIGNNPAQLSSMNLTKSQGQLSIRCANDGDAELKVRIRDINNLSNYWKEYNLSDGLCVITTDGFAKGIYVVDLIENGILVDSQKIAM